MPRPCGSHANEALRAARRHERRIRESRRRAPQKVKPHMQRVLDHITDTPAIVMTPTHEILAWNQLAAALMIDFGEVPERERNFIRLLFTDADALPLPRLGRPRALSRLVYPHGGGAQAGRPAPRRTRRRPLDQGPSVPAMLGRNARRVEEARNPDARPSCRRRDHTRLGRAHLRRARSQIIVSTAEPSSRSE
jgi:MmyB-like transcription regulator ligand binding domain